MIQIVWVFTVHPDSIPAFLKLYGKEGPWEKLFQQSPHYMGTELFRDHAQENRFILYDKWDRLHSFESFKKMHAEVYDRLDKKGEALTLEETKIGIFEAQLTL